MMDNTSKWILVFIFASLQAACMAPKESENKIAEPAKSDAPQMVGGDRDAHNCIPSAGYVWSSTRNSCVRTWEVGTRLYSTLNPKAPSTNIVIENGANGPMELWLIGGNVPFVLTKTGTAHGYGVWGDGESGLNITRADLGVLELRDGENKLLATSKAPEF